jgi:chromosome segregation ATPase
MEEYDLEISQRQQESECLQESLNQLRAELDEQRAQAEREENSRLANAKAMSKLQDELAVARNENQMLGAQVLLVDKLTQDFEEIENRNSQLVEDKQTLEQTIAFLETKTIPELAQSN